MKGSKFEVGDRVRVIGVQYAGHAGQIIQVKHIGFVRSYKIRTEEPTNFGGSFLILTKRNLRLLTPKE